MPLVLAEVAAAPEWLQYGALGLLALVLLVGGKSVLAYVQRRDDQLTTLHTTTLDVVKQNTEAHVATRETIAQLPAQLQAIVTSSVRDEFDRRQPT